MSLGWTVLTAGPRRTRVPAVTTAGTTDLRDHCRQRTHDRFGFGGSQPPHRRHNRTAEVAVRLAKAFWQSHSVAPRASLACENFSTNGLRCPIDRHTGCRDFNSSGIGASGFPHNRTSTTFTFHHGRTVRVPEDHHSIAEALASSQPNDRILIGPGTYYEMLELPNHDVMLASTDGPEVTMIDGGSNSLHALPEPSLLPSSVIRMGPYQDRLNFKDSPPTAGPTKGWVRVAGGVVMAKIATSKMQQYFRGRGVCARRPS